MDISPIAHSAITGTSLPSPSVSSAPARTHDIDEAKPDVHDRHNDFRGSALTAFQQEIRLKLKAEFELKFSFQQQNYAAVQGPPTADDVAAESLQAVRQLVDEAPTSSASSLIKFRASIEETASYVRNIVGDQEDLDDIDSAVARVDAGISELEDEVSGNRESSASVLAVETQSKQRSSIRIRTQEGDVVKLSIKRTDEFSATDRTTTGDGKTVSSTEVSVSTRSRMVLKIDGDINEAEYAAIQNVFHQAQEIANSFFGGDLEAAFNSAEGFEFDMEQLERVNMRFRLQQESNISIEDTIRVADNPGKEFTRPVIGPSTVADSSVAEPANTVAASESAPTSDLTADAPESQATSTQATLNGFFDSISRFLRSVGDGFSSGSEGGSIRLHFSESFKLEILKAVVSTTAADTSEQFADNLVEAIDKMLDVKID